MINTHNIDADCSNNSKPKLEDTPAKVQDTTMENVIIEIGILCIHAFLIVDWEHSHTCQIYQSSSLVKGN